jgi:hypothetical protein
MTLVQRTRFSDILKILTGFRGVAPGTSLAETIGPTVDVGNFDVLSDDGTMYWSTVSQSVAAVAAQFSAFGVGLAASAKPGTRAVVDGFYYRGVAPNALVVNFGLSQSSLASASNVSQHSGNFLGGRSPTVPALEQSNFATPTLSRQAAASVFSAFAGSTQNTFDTAGVSPFQPGTGGNPMRWLLTPGWGFWVEASAVNTAVSGFCWGRLLGDQT